MPNFMIQVAYTTEACQSLVKKPQDRLDAIRPAIKKLGGTVVSSYFSFGEYDAIVIAEMPDNVSAAAFSLAISAGGSCKAVRTTPLLTATEAIEAFKKAATSGYRAVAAGA